MLFPVILMANDGGGAPDKGAPGSSGAPEGDAKHTPDPASGGGTPGGARDHAEHGLGGAMSHSALYDGELVVDDEVLGSEDDYVAQSRPLDPDGMQRRVRGTPKGDAPPPLPLSAIVHETLWQRHSVFRNLTLLTLGAIIYSFGAQGIVAYGGFLTGGIYGLGILLWRTTDMLSAPMFFILLNIPFFIMGWLGVGRRLLFYSVYGIAMTTLVSEFIHFDQFLDNQLYAAVAAGIVCGVGAGLTLRSLGSGGGLDILAIILNRRWGIGIGQTYLSFNVLLFGISLITFKADVVVASFIQLYIMTFTMEKVLSMFSQRKVIFIISKNNKEIARRITHKMGVGATFLKARGAYYGSNQEVLMTVANNLQLKRLEETAFDVDKDALFIVENTFAVRGHRPFKTA